ncbi:hypothetical protein B0H11DRAFT_2072320 [Mycena galericulata]|nr:hypothetical protein B0H11DRAFT_2072320 [Mycena galericulata]
MASSDSSPASLRARLAELDEEMDALESKLRLMASERRLVVDGLNAIVYPVVTLPPEITSSIFSHYVHNPRLGHTRPSAPGRGPLTLAGVCRTWRNVCLSTGSLWASLRIYPHPSWAVDDFVHLLQWWLERVGNHPMDLRIFGCGPETAIPMKIFSVVSHHSNKLRTLGLTLDKPFSFPNDRFRGRLPLLNKLVVSFIIQGDRPVMITAFEDAPLLREVRLSGASLQWISLPWIQLTHLEFYDESVSSCLQILNETPNLEVLDVFLSRLDTPLPVSRLTLFHLRTLKFSYDPEGMLLDHLILPRLQAIQIFSLRDEGIGRFLALGVRSAWSLRSIHMDDMTIRSCIVCLRSVPSVAVVEIHAWNDHLPHELFRLLRDDPTFLPALRALTLRDCESEIFDSCFVEMLESRSSFGDQGRRGKLESLRLLFSPQVFRDLRLSVEELRTRLRPLMDTGLEIFIGSPVDEVDP